MGGADRRPEAVGFARLRLAVRSLRPIALVLAIGVATAAPAHAAEQAWIRGDIKLNFRASPNVQATPLGIVQTGDPVTVLERRDGWARIEASPGNTGWVPESTLDAQPPPTQRLGELENEVQGVRAELEEARRKLQMLETRNAELDAASAQRDAELRGLTEENRVLRAGERWPYMLMGAAILGAGMLVGALLAGRSTRRMSSRIRF
jgi:SH3 domain protein